MLWVLFPSNQYENSIPVHEYKLFSYYLFWISIQDMPSNFKRSERRRFIKIVNVFSNIDRMKSFDLILSSRFLFHQKYFACDCFIFQLITKIYKKKLNIYLHAKFHANMRFLLTIKGNVAHRPTLLRWWIIVLKVVKIDWKYSSYSGLFREN